MNLAPETTTRNRFQARLDELHQLSIALYAEAISNPSDTVVQRIEAIAIEREQVYREWEASWQEPALVADANSIEPTAAVIPAPAKPATASHTAPAPAAPAIIPAATKTYATKKLMLSIVSVKRITSDVPACNFDRNELEIAGELSLVIGGFCTPPVVTRDGNGYKVVSGHFHDSRRSFGTAT